MNQTRKERKFMGAVARCEKKGRKDKVRGGILDSDGSQSFITNSFIVSVLYHPQG
jgi:hypothetical protein